MGWFRDGFVDGFVMVSWRFRRSTKPSTKPSRLGGKPHETRKSALAVLNIIYPQARKIGFVASFACIRDFLVWFRDGFVMVSYGFGRFCPISSVLVRVL